MAEFAIKRADIHPTNPKSRKRGDIIDVADDGDFESCPNLTVLRVEGMSKEEGLKYIENVLKEAPEEAVYEKGEFDKIVDVPFEHDYNDKGAKTVYYGEFVTQPTATLIKVDMKDEKGNVIAQKDMVVLTGNTMQLDVKARFRIPAAIMDLWFSGRTRLKAISFAEWETIIKDQLLDKAHGSVAVSNTSWRQAEITP